MIAPPAYTVSDLLRRAGRLWGERPALVDGELRLCYEELLALASAHAEMLSTAGVRRGDRVAVFLPRSAAAVAALYGIAAAGAVAVPLAERFRSAQLEHVLRDAGVETVLTDARLATALEGLPVHALLTREDGYPAAATERPARSRMEARSIGRDLAALLYTSGSTGRPKGVMVTHENLVWGASIVAEYLALEPEDRLALALPLSFDYGLNQVLSATAAGACVVIDRSTHPAALCRTLERERISGLAGVPFLWQHLTQRHSPFLRLELPFLRYVTNSGGRLPTQLVRTLREAKPGLRLFLMYGLTEAFRSTYLPPEEVDRRPDSIGRPIPNSEILVLTEEGRLCEAGQTGELVHRGPTVAAGYWGDPRATARTFRSLPGGLVQDERVVYSGDLVRRDEEGFLYFVGRRDGLFKIRGIRTNAEEIELELLRCGHVADVVVFTEGNTEEPTIAAAYVPATPPADNEAVMHFCREELPPYMRPARLMAVQGVPRTAHQKPDRAQAALLWSGDKK
jgi:amino acid adenylation domain-containing protein